MKRLGTKPSLFILSGAWGVNRGVLIVTIDKIKKMIRECEGFNPHCRGVLIVTFGFRCAWCYSSAVSILFIEVF